tara:strand:+ start:1115 stop:2077 length:963 start_codon:yes stop_codon:yes gene_type:complete
MGVNFTRSQVAKEKQRIETTRPPGFTFPLGLSYGKLVLASANAFPTTTGGTKTIDSTNSVHAFTTSGNFKPSFTGTVEYLQIAGGGSGAGTAPGGGVGGGGGAGGLVYAHSVPVDKDVTYSIVIGAGGAGNAGAPVSSTYNGTNTTTSLATVVDAIGGGGFTQPGGSGGGHFPTSSGQGVGVQSTQNPMPSSAGLSLGNSSNGARGGGGAGSTGNDGEPSGLGGKGYALSISGTRVGYAGGGGGGAAVSSPHESPGLPVSIPTGAGAHGPDGPGGSGAVNRGSGGGGCQGSGAGSGGGGGSGVAFVRYISNQQALDYFIT